MNAETTNPKVTLSANAARFKRAIWRWFPEIMLAASLAILFHRLILGEVIFWGTPLLQFYPWRRMAFDELRAGRLPLWNPMLGNGAPLLANYQTAVFYPPNWLYLIIPTEYAMGWVGLLHLFWAGLGMVVYLRSLSVTRLGQGIGALAYALSGYLVARFAFLSITSVVPWLPWLVWSVDRLMRGLGRKERSIALVGGIVALILLGGHAQTAIYSLVLAGLYALWRAMVVENLLESWRHLAMALVAVLLGIGLAAIQLVPTFELLQTSQRAGGLHREFALTYSFWPWRFLSLLSPNIFGTPANGTYQGYANYWEDAIYVGLLPLVLAAWSMGRWWEERRTGAVTLAAQVIPFFGALLIPTFVLALGKNTPVLPWLYDHIPGFDLFQAPTRITLLIVFGLAVLAGVGADGWKNTSRGLAWSRRSIAGGAAILLGALCAQFLLNNTVAVSLIRGAARAGLMVILVAVLCLTLRRVDWHPQWRQWWEAAALILLAADLVTAHWGLNPTVDASYYQRSSALANQLSRITADTRTFYLPEDEYQAKFASFFSFKSFQVSDIDHWVTVRDSLLPNLGMLDGIRSANNFDPLLVGSYDALIGSLDELTPEEQLRALPMLSAGILLTPTQRTDLDEVAYVAPIYAYRVPDPWSRVSVADCEVSQGEERCTPLDGTRAEILQEQPQHIVICVAADKASSFLLLDTYYPDWVARVDGEDVPIRRVNGTFRAVAISAGVHEVILEYHPRSVLIGGFVTTIALLITTALLFCPRAHHAAKGKS